MLALRWSRPAIVAVLAALLIVTGAACGSGSPGASGSRSPSAGPPLTQAQLIAGARRWWAGVDGCGAALERDGCLRYAGCDLVYCEGPQGHRWPADATARIWRFFRAHPRRS